MIRISVWLSVILLANLFSPVHAASDSDTLTCFASYGTIWGEDEKDVPKREINGSAIKTPNDLARATGTREHGLKIIKGGDFSGWDMRGLSLHGVCFEKTNLSGANLAGVTAAGSGFIKSDLTGADMQGAVMPGVMFRDANLTDVKAQKANFHGGHFDGGWFEGGVAGWNLDGATMIEFTFECGITVPDGCPVYQGGDDLSARGADFSKATLHSFGLFNIALNGAKLDKTIIGPGQLPFLDKADIKGDLVLRGGSSNISITAAEARTLIVANAKERARQDKPSFNCAKARSKVETEICGEYGGELRRADREIATLYRWAKAGNRGVKSSQRQWLKDRNKCSSEQYASDCIRQSYSKRKGQLLAMLGESDWLKPGESALFVDDVLPLSDELKKTGLYAKITPTLVGASMTEILVRRTEGGLYTIKGSAVGANAHLCSLDARSLYLDKKTGWYIPVSEEKPMPIFRIFDGRLEIFENGRPEYGKYPETGNYMSCGARASFSETIRINVDADTLAKIEKSLTETM